MPCRQVLRSPGGSYVSEGLWGMDMMPDGAAYLSQEPVSAPQTLRNGDKRLQMPGGGCNCPVGKTANPTPAATADRSSLGLWSRSQG